MADQTLQLPKEGDKVGSGILLSLISTGGSAYIYKTWNESLELHRAVKVMSPDAPSDVRDRFQTEARINSKLLHPNIVQCFNFGLTSGCLPYLEMEYLSGPSLAEIIRKFGPLPLSVSLAICIGLLDGLSYAHTVKYTLYDKQHIGLVHRDLKPANVVISADGVTKLMDFGIARPVDISLHTVAGTVPGTVAYMSPEACSGGDVDFRSDIYQFGLFFYELLTGHAAFPQSDLTSLLEAKASNKFPPVESLVKNLDRRILPILRRCLQLDPRERYQSAQSCLSDIRSLFGSICPSVSPVQHVLSFLDGRPVSSSSNSRIGFLRVIKTSALVVSVVLLISCGFFAVKYVPVLLKTLWSSKAVSVPSPVPLQTTVDTVTVPAPVLKPAAVPAKKPVSRQSKPVVRSRDTASSSLLVSLESAPYWVEQGIKQFKAGQAQAALSSFQTALKKPSASRQQTIRICVYWSARCNSALYKEGSVPLSNYKASWQSVLNVYPVGSPEHAEASKNLQGVK